MDNALLISLSQQMALKRRMDVIANNMANVGTAGFKADHMRFEEFMMPVARVEGLSGDAARLSYVLDKATYRDFQSGDIERTGNELDVAISGDGWFVVKTPEGERYTRDGRFKINADGQLVTSAGHPVLGDGGPIVFAPDEAGIEIAQDGFISTTDGLKGRLQLVRFEDNAQLSKQGTSLFAAEALPLPAEDARVMQGMVEKSNVQPILEVTRMIETVRTYTQVAQAIQTAHEMRRDAITRLGRME